jgi:hypothetical protein
MEHGAGMPARETGVVAKSCIAKPFGQRPPPFRTESMCKVRAAAS